MDQQQYPPQAPQAPEPQPPYPYGVPQGMPPVVAQGRLEPIGESWATGVGPVRLGAGSSRFRWAVALGMVMVVALVTAGGAYVLSGAGGAAKSLTAASAPKSTVMFMDLRIDLPGDQHQKLADFMSHFPGFADRAQFDSAYDEILNKITGSISPDFTYTSAFKSWATGELSIAITNLGSGLTVAPEPTVPLPEGTSESGDLIVSLKDRAAGEAWVGTEASKVGLTFTAQDYAGTKLYVSNTTDSSGRLTAAYAFTDKVLLLGTVDAVKASLDAPANGSLADNPNYQAAMSSLSGDSIASYYVDIPTVIKSEMAGLSGVVGFSASGLNIDSLNMPAWMTGSVRAESDHMTVEWKVPKGKDAATDGNHESVVASELPASTIGVFELHSVGQTVNKGLTAMEAVPAEASPAAEIKDALDKVGGLDWVGDADFVLTKTGSDYGGGVVVVTTDSATATAKKAMITNLVALGGGSLGLTLTDEAYKGTTITKVHIPDDAGMSLGNQDFTIAAKGNLIVTGYGDAFVKSVIDTTSDTSLAAQSTYKSVMAAAGTSNMGYGYFDISAVADDIAKTFSGSTSGYDLNYKPYVDHIGGAAFTVVDGSTVTLRFIITAK